MSRLLQRRPPSRPGPPAPSRPGPLDRGARAAGRALLIAAAWFESPAARGFRLLLSASLGALYAGVLGWTVRASGTLNFSTDSWTYQELAGTVLRGDFYRFSTVRSYFSPEFSAAFPPLFPGLLALVRLLPGGASPVAAVWLNAGLALTAGALTLRLGRRLGAGAAASMLLAASLLLAPGFLDEVLSGRSVPAAVVLLLLAGLCGAARRPFMAGLCLGMVALTRFDLLPVVLLALAGLAGWGKAEAGRVRASVRLVLGALLGASPWVVYSLVQFHLLWASDNAWVASSAAPAFNLDFPARAALSASQAPGVFASRVLGNVAPLLSAVTLAGAAFPLALLGFAALAGARAASPRAWRQGGLFAVALTAALAPYLLTGYAEVRYFTPHLLLLGLALLVAARGLACTPRAAEVFALLCAAALLLTLQQGAGTLTARAVDGVWNTLHPDPAPVQMAQLRRCQRAAPGSVVVFAGRAQPLGPRYGAQMHARAALVASNLGRMTPVQQDAYFSGLRPFLLLEDARALPRCPELNRR